MRIQQSYLKPHLDVTGLSGDQLMCERQRCMKRHIMDGDTAKERLDYLEPKIEDWHALQTFLMVRKHMDDWYHSGGSSGDKCVWGGCGFKT